MMADNERELFATFDKGLTTNRETGREQLEEASINVR